MKGEPMLMFATVVVFALLLHRCLTHPWVNGIRKHKVSLKKQHALIARVNAANDRGEYDSTGLREMQAAVDEGNELVGNICDALPSMWLWMVATMGTGLWLFVQWVDR